MKLPNVFEWFDEQVMDDWTENKLLSRKWTIVLLVVVWVLVLDTLGRPIAETSASIMQWTVTPFITLQGFVDILKYRTIRRKQWWLDNKEKPNREEAL